MTNKSCRPIWVSHVRMSRRSYRLSRVNNYSPDSTCTNWFRAYCIRKASSRTWLSACSQSAVQRGYRREPTAECTPDSTSYGTTTV